MVGKRILVKKSSQTRSSQEALFLGYHAFRGAGRAIRKNMTPHPAAADQTAVEVDSLNFCYGSKQALFNVTMKIPKNRVTAFIGPSGCGKSTLLRCINRMNDRIPEARVTGALSALTGWT